MDVEKTMQFILEQQAKHEVWLQEMRAGFDKLFESQQRTDQAIKSLVEQGRHTDERLNALIKVVDDLVRRNGSPKKR